MRVVFFGSGPFALPALERLQANSRRVELARVVTRPDRAQKRGKKIAATPVRIHAAALGLPCEAPESVNDAEYLETLANLSADLFIVADYGEMLRKPLRETPRTGVFNLHASILPRCRGAAPVVHSILMGETETGVTLFRIEKGLDSGPVVDTLRTDIGPLETAGELEQRLARLAADLLERNLDAFANVTFREATQDERLATLAPKVEKQAGAIRWESPAGEVANAIRAFNPWPGAYSFLEGQDRTIFLRAKPAEPASAELHAPGTVDGVGKESFRVRCGQGDVEILEVQREGKAPLAAGAYLRGRPLRPGDRFTPEGVSGADRRNDG